MGWGDEEKVKGQFPWEKNYIKRENWDGSVSIHEEGIFGGLGKEVGKETKPLFGSYTRVESGGGSTDVYSPSFFGPDLNTSEGISRALRDARRNAPQPSDVSTIAGSASLGYGPSGGVSGGYGGGYGSSGAFNPYAYGYGGGGCNPGLRKVGVGSFIGWAIGGAASALIPCIFAASCTWGTLAHPAYLEALKALALYGTVACLIACTIAAAAGFTRERLSEAIFGAAIAGTVVTIVVNSYLNWRYAAAPVGYLRFPLAVWLIVPGFVVAAVPISIVRGRLPVASSKIGVTSFVWWGVVGAVSAIIPLVPAAAFTWVERRHLQYGTAFSVLALLGTAAGLIACAIGVGGGLTREGLSRWIYRGAITGAIITIAVNSYLNWQYAHEHLWGTKRLLEKIWLTAPAFLGRHGHKIAMGHLRFPIWVWVIVPACVVAAVGIGAMRNRGRP